MKRYSRIILIQALAAWLMLVSISQSYAVFIDRTSTVTATATRPLTPGTILDEFNSGVATNAWGGTTGTFVQQGSSATCAATYPSSPDPVTSAPGKCLQLTYNVNQSASYAGYFTSFGGGSISSYRGISFYVKGGQGGEFFKIEFKNNSADANRNHAAIYITDYLDGGVTTSWQQVIIPMHNFVNIDSWTSMKELTIVFENSQSATNGSPTQGTVYIDNITFDTTMPGAVRIDHFGDKVGMSALGGNIGDMGGSGGTSSYAFSSLSGTYSLYPNSLRSTYDVNTGWAGHFMIFGGGDDGWTAIKHDFSIYDYLSIYLKAASSTKNPKTIKLELVDNYGTWYYIVTGITNSWTSQRIPLSSFLGLNKSTIKQLNIVYEDWRITGAGGNKSGIVYFDRIQFEAQ